MGLPTGLLVLPAESDGRFRDLLRKLRMLVVRDVLGRDARALPEPLAHALPPVQRALVGCLRRTPADVLAAVGDPDVLPPLLAMTSGVASPESMLPLAIPALLARLGSRRGAIEDAVLWDVPLASLALEGGIARFEPEARGLVANAAGIDVRLADGSEVRLDRNAQERTTHAISGLDAHLSLHDANPLAMNEEHPDKKGNAVSLGDRSLDEWTQQLAEAVELIRVALPTVHAELTQTVHRIVPVGWEPERHLSASYREAPGLVYVTLHPSALTLAEAIVHETQHGKLNVLSYFDPALVNGRTTWTPSPVRPDLRPLSGVLLAVHAFVPVAALHLRLAALDHPIMSTPEASARRAQVIAGNERGLRIVHELGEPTAIGRQILLALDALHAATRAALPSATLDGDALPPA